LNQKENRPLIKGGVRKKRHGAWEFVKIAKIKMLSKLSGKKKNRRLCGNPNSSGMQEGNVVVLPKIPIRGGGGRINRRLC